MQRLAAAFASAGLLGTVAACGAPGHDPPRHIVAPESDSADFHASMAALQSVRDAVVPDRALATRNVRASRSGARPRSPSPSPSARPTGDVWVALARCESGMRNDTGAPYYGYFQFSASTWRSLGYGGVPSEHDYAAQQAAAQRLVARSGWGQFPACARRLGLR